MSTLRHPTDAEVLAAVHSPAVVHPTDEEPKVQDATPPDDSALRPGLQKVFEEGWKQNEAGYRHLAGR
jgi:hypothetical protein